MTTIQQVLIHVQSIPCFSDSTTDDYWIGVLGKNNSGSKTYGAGLGVDSSGNVYGVGFTRDQTGGHLNPYTWEAYVYKIDVDGDFQWQRILGESGRQNSNYDQLEFYDAAVDSSGNVYGCGKVYENNPGNTDGPAKYLIGKWNTSGTLQWQRIIGGNGGQNTGEASYTQACGCDSSDNLYVIGRVWVSKTCIFVCKYNSSGSLQWQRVLSGGTGAAAAYGGYVDSSGNTYITGFSDYHTSGGRNDGILVKYNSSGTLQWQKLFAHSDGSTNASIHNCATDPDGNIFTTSNSLGIAKWNSSGTLQWQKTLGGRGGWCIACDECGNAYMGDFIENVISGSSENDIVISKWDADGNLEWQRAFGCNSSQSDQSDFITWGNIFINDAHSICVTATTEAVYSDQNAVIFKLPNDGSLTGTHGNFVYQACNLTVATPSHSSSNASLSSATSGASSSTSSYPESSKDNSYNKDVIN